VRRVLLARHGESELSVQGILNGDPGVPCGLTARGEEQARELGRTLRDEPVELAIVSDFERCRATARIALAGRDVPELEVPELGDIRNGVFEGGDIGAYRAWASGAQPTDTPQGGESRADAARRFAAGLLVVLERPEASVLVVSHQLPIADVLEAARGSVPARTIGVVPYAQAFALTAEELSRAADTLAAWALSPT
jgi:broad specificity phosphatase PhoE